MTCCPGGVSVVSRGERCAANSHGGSELVLVRVVLHGSERSEIPGRAPPAPSPWIPKKGDSRPRILCHGATKRNMKLRPFILALLAAAVAVPNAGAVQLQTVSRDGTKTTSRDASKSCSFQADYQGVGDLLAVCDGAKGSATARYDFYLPGDAYGTPTMHVYADKLCCARSAIKKTLVKVEKLHYRIVITVSKPTSYDIQSVSLSYYVKS